MFFQFVSWCALVHLAVAQVQFLGMSISGGDFGCQIDGSCPLGSVQLPLSSLGGGDGQAQMKHFVQDDKLNMFRLPISWQFLTANKLSAPLDAANLAKYDQLVQACLATGAHCMIDIHNFARWNGGIIGQGGPTDDAFVSLWTQLATKYAAADRVVFELMNEPHDLDIALWAATCQKVVTAIRGAGATAQTILLPGTNFDSAATLISSGSADALLAITNPDGTTDGLMLDVHKYLDTDNSGTHAPCTTDNADAFTTLAAYLRAKGRRAMVSETGASSDASCLVSFCAQNRVINANADVYAGLVVWAAGSFASSYLLSLTPAKKGGALVDGSLMTECVLGTWKAVDGGANGTTSGNVTMTRASTATTLATSTITAASTKEGSSTTSVVRSASLNPTSSATRTSANSAAVTSSAGTTTRSIDDSEPTFGSDTMVVTLASAAADEPATLMIATGSPTPHRGGGGMDGTLVVAPSRAPSAAAAGATGDGPAGTSAPRPSGTGTGAVAGSWAGRRPVPVGLAALCLLPILLL